MTRTWRRDALLLAATSLLAAPNLAPAQEAKVRAPDASATVEDKPVAKDQRASGVIIKAEPIAGTRPRGENQEAPTKDRLEHPRQVRLTINTAAVWQDWVRDQASLDQAKLPRREARDGAKSVATEGEPADRDTVVVVDLAPETRVETRFRASTDETSKGARTPEGAARAAADPADDPSAPSKSPGKARSRDGEKAQHIPRFTANDLKLGLFVEIDYTYTPARNRAKTVTVIRPVGGPDTPPSTSTPTETKPSKP